MSACEDPQATHPPWSLENYPPGKNFLDQNRTERGKEREKEGEREGGEGGEREVRVGDRRVGVGGDHRGEGEGGAGRVIQRLTARFMHSFFRRVFLALSFRAGRERERERERGGAGVRALLAGSSCAL